MLSRDPHARWGGVSAWLYAAVVARGQDELYDRLLLPVRAAGVTGRVLDVGAGPGHAAVKLARAHPDAAIVGVDRSAAMVAHAARRAREAHASNASFVG